MSKVPIFLVLIFFASTSSALEYKHAVGAGVQYGGILGWRGSVVGDRNRLNLGVGVIGVTIGYEYSVSHKWSFGANVSGIALISAVSLHANRYFSGLSSPGWMVGVDLIRMHSAAIFGDSEIHETHLLVSAGYQF